RNTIAVRTERWKYIPPTAHDGRLGWPATGHEGTEIDTGDRREAQLYDLLADPGETVNVASEYPHIVSELYQFTLR
ncbi:MAG: hypothetical protein K2H79_05515, partial [Bacteroidaceae bacterium]|nr:hypothetical protein [Bacteroidaceae bacterium]